MSDITKIDKEALSTSVLSLLKKQEGRCHWCKIYKISFIYFVISSVHIIFTTKLSVIMKKISSVIKWISLSAVVLLSAVSVSAIKDNEVRSSSDLRVAQTTPNIEIPAPMKNCSEEILVRRGYTASYNLDNKIPNWVAWHLTFNHCFGPYKRAGIKFQEDTDIPEDKRSVNWDYYNSGYDRGHMCPAGDNKWDAEALVQSFLFTNICPQQGNLNRGDWAETEKACRKWAKKFRDIYIVCGPILYHQKHKTIGDNKVVVPEGFFKVVLCMRGTPKAIGFIFKNAKCNNPLSFYANSVDQVERMTGIDFFPQLPDDIENKVEAECNLNDWQN